VALTRRYTVELESSPLGKELTVAVLDAFVAAVETDRKLVEPKPDADLDLGRLELRTGVNASGPTNALAVVEVAFVRAAEKAGLRVAVAEACVWAEEDSASAA
jgi:hypothetical protein